MNNEYVTQLTEVLDQIKTDKDTNLLPENIKMGITVLGVEGNLEPDKPDQTKTADPSVQSQTIRPDTGYELASVTINPVTSSIDQNIQPQNIKKNVEILGTTGTFTTNAYKVESVEEMNALTDMENGDYCVVYSDSGSSVLPSGYTKVEYLQSSGTQYIDTNYAPYKTKVETTFVSQNNSSNTSGYVVAAHNADNNRYYVVKGDFYNNAFVCSDRSNTSIVLGSFDNNRHTVIYNDENNKVLFDGVIKGTVSDLTQQGVRTLYLFALHNSSNSAQEFLIGKIYNVKITDKDTGNLVRSMVPCIRNNDSTAGMYDLVNGVFYTNQGTGTFTAGAVVPTGIDYTIYQYSGSTWVDITDEILTSITITPSTSSQTPAVPTGYRGFKSVTVNAVTSAIDNNIQANNIRNNISILGVTGNLVDYSSDMASLKTILELSPSATSQDVIDAVTNLKQTSEETIEAAEAIADIIIEGSQEQSGGE